MTIYDRRQISLNKIVVRNNTRTNLRPPSYFLSTKVFVNHNDNHFVVIIPYDQKTYITQIKRENYGPNPNPFKLCYLQSLDLGLFKRFPLLVKEKCLSLLVNYKHLNGFVGL